MSATRSSNFSPAEATHPARCNQQKLLLASLPELEKELQDQVKLQQAVAPPTANPSLPQDSHPTTSSAVAAIVSGEHKYTEIKVT